MCHYNPNASLTWSILGSQTAPTCPSQSGSAHGLKVWNHHCLIGHSGNDTPLFPYKWNKTKVSHLLVMSIQSIHYWSSIKDTDYSSPVLRECHHQANMAARCPDVENNPGSNQVNIDIRSKLAQSQLINYGVGSQRALLKSLRHVKISPKEFLYQYFAIPYGSEVGKIFVWVGETR